MSVSSRLRSVFGLQQYFNQQETHATQHNHDQSGDVALKFSVCHRRSLASDNPWICFALGGRTGIAIRATLNSRNG
jgi:hypothetical protein